MTANKRKKPQLEYIDKSMTVNGKWTKEHTEAVKAADRIFNGPSLTPKPGKRKKKK